MDSLGKQLKTYSVGLGLLALAKGTLEQASYIAMVKPHLREVALRHNGS